MLPVHQTPRQTPKSVYNYDEIPAGYYFEAMVKGKPAQRFWHQKKFEAVAARIQDGERVLDFGCGPGSFFSVLGRMRPRCQGVGVDVASPQIDFASTTIAALGMQERLKFLKIPLENPKLPFDDRSFDVVTNIEVIEHIHPFLAMQMYAEIRRVLKPDGRLLVTTPNYRSFWPLIEMALEVLSPVKYHAQHINRFTPSSFVKFLESAGFELRRLESLFIAAPFTAGLSWRGAEGLLSLERKLPGRLGSLLMAECGLAKF